MAKNTGEPSSVAKEMLERVVSERAARECKTHKVQKCETVIIYTGKTTARVTFWLDGADNVALYELTDGGTWYCRHDWND